MEAKGPRRSSLQRLMRSRNLAAMSRLSEVASLRHEDSVTFAD